MKQELIKKLQAAQEEIKQITFDEEFYKYHPPIHCKIANTPENRLKNKANFWGYPYDHNRITSIPHYINASPMEFAAHRYIAAQGPRQNTFNEFWHMVWAEESSLIVSVTNERETWGTHSGMKFDRFWPLYGTQSYGEFEVQKVKETMEVEWQDGRRERICRRLFVIEHQGEKREVTHLHMENWPDNGVILPESLYHLAHHADKWKGKGSIIVHCAAGIGRTGTFIAFHSLYHDLMTHVARGTYSEWNILARVQEMRKLRWGAIISAETQYKLLINSLHFAIENHTFV